MIPDEIRATVMNGTLRNTSYFYNPGAKNVSCFWFVFKASLPCSADDFRKRGRSAILAGVQHFLRRLAHEAVGLCSCLRLPEHVPRE